MIKKIRKMQLCVKPKNRWDKFLLKWENKWAKNQSRRKISLKWTAMFHDMRGWRREAGSISIIIKVISFKIQDII